MEENLSVLEKEIKNQIYNIRGKQVMLDSDLAKLYQVETKNLNKAVNRNIKRFPEKFRFQLNKDEYEEILRLNFGTSKSKQGGRRYLPYAFTEQGVSMLSAVLKSDIAIDISIKIIETFVEMRKFLSSNSSMLERFERVEQRLAIHDETFDEIFKMIESKDTKPKQGIFFDGQMFDAYEFVANLIRSAKKNIKLIDNYVDDTVLTLFSKNQNIDVTIYTQKRNLTKQLKLDLEKYNSQYREIKIKEFNKSHDRFMIIDDVEVYLIGASLKDLGKKWFGFSKMDIESFGLVEKLDSFN